MLQLVISQEKTVSHIRPGYIEKHKKMQYALIKVPFTAELTSNGQGKATNTGVINE